MSRIRFTIGYRSSLEHQAGLTKPKTNPKTRRVCYTLREELTRHIYYVLNKASGWCEMHEPPHEASSMVRGSRFLNLNFTYDSILGQPLTL